MKKITIITAVLAALCSCAKEKNSSTESSGMYPLVVSASAGEDEGDDVGDTRAWTYVDIEKKVFKFRWVNNDKVGAFDNRDDVDGGHEFNVPNGSGKATASLVGEVCPDATGQIVFLYPRQNNTWTQGSYSYRTHYDVANHKITEIKIPFDYGTIVAGSLDVEKVPRIGVLSSKEAAEEETVNMYNPLCAICFTLKNSDSHKFTRIEFFGNLGEQLAGYCDLNVTDPADPKVVFFPTPYLSNEKAHRVAYDLLLNTSGSIIPDGVYLASLAPVNFTKGIKFKFSDDKGNVAFLGSTAPLTIERNHIRDFKTFDAAALNWRPAIDLRFLNAPYVKPGFPFKESLIETVNTVNTQHFALKDGSGQTVEFKTYGSEVKWYNSGLNLKGVGGYIEVPAIEGKVLKEIWLRLSSTGGKNGNPCIVRASDGNYLKKDGSWAAVAAGSTIADDPNADIWSGNKNFGYYKSWKNSFEAGKTYRIQLTDGGESMKIEDLVIFYAPATQGGDADVSAGIEDWNPGLDAGAILY